MNRTRAGVRYGLSTALCAILAVTAWVQRAQALETAYADMSFSFTAGASDGTASTSQGGYNYGYASGGINGVYGADFISALYAAASWAGGASWGMGISSPQNAYASSFASSSDGYDVDIWSSAGGWTDIEIIGATASSVDLIINPLAQANLSVSGGSYSSAFASWGFNLYDDNWQYLTSFGLTYSAWNGQSLSATETAPVSVAGLTPAGTYHLNWFAQAVARYREPTPVPDGGLTVTLLGGALVGFAGVRRRFAA